MFLETLVISLLLSVTLALFYIFYPRKIVFSETNTSYRNAIIVSDIHCRRGTVCKVLECIVDYAKKNGFECIIVIGDLFEDFHEKVSFESLSRELRSILPEDSYKLVYTTSRSSHDPLIEKKYSLNIGEITVDIYPGPLILKVAGIKLYLLHGDSIVPNGVVAHAVNRLATYLGIHLFLEKLVRKKARIRDGWVIMGHTHIPGIDYEKGVANTGAWKNMWVAGIPYWRKPSGTMIIVNTDGNVKLVNFSKSYLNYTTQ